jgi:hypothetical protein
MTMLGDDFRHRAEENNKTANDLFGAADFATNAKTQTAAVIAKVTANFLYVAGEMVDYLRLSEAGDASSVRRREYAERSEKIRNAYMVGMSSGDFSTYDRLLDEFAAALANRGEPDGDSSDTPA